MTDDEFRILDSTLDSIEVHGHRGYDESELRSPFRRKLDEDNKDK